MKIASEIRDLFPGLKIEENTPLAKYTTFRIGGPCPLMIENARADDLPGLLHLLNQNDIPFLVIGQGSNLVISDKGLDAAVIRFCSETPQIETAGRQLTVSGDTLLDALVQYTIEQNLGDLSFCSGIPGTVGGGLAGNAGAFGRQLSDQLLSAKILEPDGTIFAVTPRELEFSYRHSNLKETGNTVLSATFELPATEQDTMRQERERIMAFRRENHPDWHITPCAGSIFRNIEPTSAAKRRQAAGFFLDLAGAGNLRVGGARLYKKHANMIVAEKGCTAQNIRDLSEKMKQAVQQKFDLALTREVRFLGEF